jgi:hypothetical protein
MLFWQRMISPVQNRLAYILPPALTLDGDNELRVTAKGDAVEIVYIDCTILTNNNLRQ